MSFEAFNLSGGQYKKLFGRTIGNVCDVLNDPAMKKEVKNFLPYTNITWTYGTCPFPAGTVDVLDWTPDSIGDYIPPYIPGICLKNDFFNRF